MKHFCPVCGYDALTRPPVDYYICPCCGTEFGYDDIAHTWDELRAAWVSKGASWFSKHNPPPADWDVLSQIGRLTVQNMYNVAGTTNRDVTVKDAFLNPVQVSPVSQAPVRMSATTQKITIDKVAA